MDEPALNNQSKGLTLKMTSDHGGTPDPASEKTSAASAEETALLGAVLASLEDSKAEDSIVIDITGKTALADHIVIVSGRSHRHVGAIADHLLRDLKAAGHGTSHVEGLPHCDWVLVDAGDIVIHIFRPEVREFYNMEKMWTIDSSAPPQYFS